MSSPVSLSGFGGLNTAAIIDSLIQQASQPILLLQDQQQTTHNKISAIQALSSQVLSLRNAADNLVDPTLFTNVNVSSSSGSAITATAANGATAGAGSSRRCRSR